MIDRLYKFSIIFDKNYIKYRKLESLIRIINFLKVPQELSLSFFSKFIKNDLESETESINILSKLDANCGTTSISKKKNISPKKDLQIVVPVYNSEKTIRDCLESIIFQKTKYNFVVDVIDDGSTDSSLRIIDELSSKKFCSNGFFRISHKSNCGVSAARNLALDRTDSKYILFVDSDDILASNAVEVMLNEAVKKNLDIVEGSYVAFNDNRVLFSRINKNKSMVNPYKYLSGFPWGKLYKSDLFRDVKFPENYWFEDTVLEYRIYSRSEKISTISRVTYKYRINKNGITAKSQRSNKAIDTVWVTNQLLKDCISNNELLTQDIYDFTLRQFVLNIRRLSHFPIKVRKAAFVYSKMLMEKYFINFETNNLKLKKAEKYLRNNDFSSFQILAYLDI